MSNCTALTVSTVANVRLAIFLFCSTQTSTTACRVRLWTLLLSRSLTGSGSITIPKADLFHSVDTVHSFLHVQGIPKHNIYNHEALPIHLFPSICCGVRTRCHDESICLADSPCHVKARFFYGDQGSHERVKKVWPHQQGSHDCMGYCRRNGFQ